MFTMMLPRVSVWTKHYEVDVNTYYNTVKLGGDSHFTDEDEKVWRDVVTFIYHTSNKA